MKQLSEKDDGELIAGLAVDRLHAAACKPNFVSPDCSREATISLGFRLLGTSSDLPADKTHDRGRGLAARATPIRIFGLAAGGVCRAARVTTNAVRSYRTFSPLLGSKDEG